MVEARGDEVCARPGRASGPGGGIVKEALGLAHLGKREGWFLRRCSRIFLPYTLAVAATASPVAVSWRGRKPRRGALDPAAGGAPWQGARPGMGRSAAAPWERRGPCFG